jgi:hypothetical protein
VYRGAPGQEFADALASIAAGESVTTAYVAAQGTQVQYRERDITAVSYEKDVAPIIAENCASCHREGGIAPFALDSHAMVQGWSPMIREVMMTKRMPPGQIDPHINEFKNSYVVPFDDQRKVLDWIAAGSQKDGNTDPLAMIEWPPTEWAFGEPDYIIEVAEQAIPVGDIDVSDAQSQVKDLSEDVSHAKDEREKEAAEAALVIAQARLQAVEAPAYK